MKEMLLKKSISKLVLLLLVVLTFGSCANLKNFHNNKARGEAGIVRISQYKDNKCSNCNNVKQDGEGTFLWSYYNANRRGSVMYVKDGKIRVLAENAPDAAIQSITDISAKVKGIESVDVEAAFNTQRTIAQLGKRTAAVNMLRDALYRLNELYYASLDENSTLLNKAMDKGLLKSDSLQKTFNKIDFVGNNQMFETLFCEIIQNAKDISISEAQAETQIAKSESESEVEKQKTEQLRLQTISDVLEKTEKKILTEEDSKKLIEEILKTKQ